MWNYPKYMYCPLPPKPLFWCAQLQTLYSSRPDSPGQLLQNSMFSVKTGLLYDWLNMPCNWIGVNGVSLKINILGSWYFIIVPAPEGSDHSQYLFPDWVPPPPPAPSQDDNRALPVWARGHPGRTTCTVCRLEATPGGHLLLLHPSGTWGLLHPENWPPKLSELVCSPDPTFTQRDCSLTHCAWLLLDNLDFKDKYHHIGLLYLAWVTPLLVPVAPVYILPPVVKPVQWEIYPKMVGLYRPFM